MTSPEPWLSGIREALDRAIEQAEPLPDFLDVVERAHHLDPKAVPEHAVTEADGLAPVVALHSAPSGPDQVQLDAQLDTLLDGVRRTVEHHASQPPPEPEFAQPVRDRRIWWWIGGAVAAALAVAFGLGPLLQTLNASSNAERTVGGQASHVRDEQAPQGRAATPPPPVVPSPRVTPPTATPEVPLDTIEPPTEAETMPAEPRRRPSGTPSRRDKLAALTEQAQRAWSSGDRAEARRLFAQIVRRGGRTAAAEMAYADLFTLAHQQRDRSEQRRLWSDYLRRFPRGRFADDARGGLCRTAARADRAACWTRYLEHSPKGSFRQEARAATTAVEDSSP